MQVNKSRFMGIAVFTGDIAPPTGGQPSDRLGVAQPGHVFVGPAHPIAHKINVLLWQQLVLLLVPRLQATSNTRAIHSVVYLGWAIDLYSKLTGSMFTTLFSPAVPTLLMIE